MLVDCDRQKSVLTAVSAALRFAYLIVPAVEGLRIREEVQMQSESRLSLIPTLAAAAILKRVTPVGQQQQRRQ